MLGEIAQEFSVHHFVNNRTLSLSTDVYFFATSYFSSRVRAPDASAERESGREAGAKKIKRLWTFLEKRTLFSLLPHVITLSLSPPPSLTKLNRATSDFGLVMQSSSPHERSWGRKIA